MKRRSFLRSAGAAGLGITFVTPGTDLSSQTNSSRSVTEAQRSVPVKDSYEVIVCGAGPAGVSAAVESARRGAKTLLVEAHGSLGGIWTAGLLTWILDHAGKTGFMREIERELIARGGANREIDTGRVLSFDPEVMKLLLEELCVDAGVDILYHTRVVSSVQDSNKRLTHIITESKSGREAWAGKIFIDSTGDGDLAALSGCGFDLGREGDGAMQPFSLLALVTGIYFDEIKDFSRWAGDSNAGSPSKMKFLEEIERGGFSPSYLKPALYPIRKDLFKMMANHEYGVSSISTKDVTKATIHARKEINSIINSLRNNGGVWRNIRLLATAEQIGTREGRRIHGLYTITKDDLINGSGFDDAVCSVTAGVDVHSLARPENKHSQGAYNEGIRSRGYDIPLRSLIAADVYGLMMAGRCISGDFFAHSSYRMTGNAVAMGEAAGRTAAVAAKRNILPQEV